MKSHILFLYLYDSVCFQQLTQLWSWIKGRAMETKRDHRHRNPPWTKRGLCHVNCRLMLERREPLRTVLGYFAFGILLPPSSYLCPVWLSSDLRKTSPPRPLLSRKLSAKIITYNLTATLTDHAIRSLSNHKYQLNNAEPKVVIINVFRFYLGHSRTKVRN